MKTIFSIGSCTFILLHTEPDGTSIYEITRHGFTISYGETFPPNSDRYDFENWVKSHGYM